MLVFGLLFFSGGAKVREDIRNESRQRFAIVNANLVYTGDKAALWAEFITRKLAGPEKTRNAAQVLEQCKSLWPDAVFSLYDKNGELLPSSVYDGAGDFAPAAHTARALVGKALVGQTIQDFTKTRGFLSISAAAPIPGTGTARAVLVSVPLDPVILSEIKARSGAEIAVLPFDDINTANISDLSSAAATFSRTRGATAELWPEIGKALVDAKPIQEQSLEFRDGMVQVTAGALTGINGDALGILAVAPVHTPKPGIPLLHLLAAALAGVAAVVVVSLCIYRRAELVSGAVAVELAALADEKSLARVGASDWSGWPERLEAAFSSLSTALKSCRERVWCAEAALQKAGSGSEAQQQQHENAYLRLFSNIPVGAFQVEENGRFVRVNQTFAMLLGYESVMQLLTEAVSLTEFFLYGDEIRNPLRALYDAGGGRQVVTLRKKDGRIGNFALLCTSLTTPEGELSGVLEGFLLDRELEERMTKAERAREYADKERASLALLLAATCRQTESYLTSPREVGLCGFEAIPESADEQSAEASGKPEERRKSVVAAKAVLEDIYQIARIEAEHIAPVPVPFELGRFMGRLCRQTIPTLTPRGISLRCEIAEELLLRFSGPAPLLRHALQRALLAVAGPVRGGWICLSVMRDPNSPRTQGSSRMLISASWSSFAPDSGGGGHMSLAPVRSGGPSGFSTFEVPVNPEHVDYSLVGDAGTLEISEELEVIRYLTQRMQGDLLESSFNNDLRSIRVVVPLDHLTLTADAGAEQPVESGDARDSEFVSGAGDAGNMAAVAVAALGVGTSPSYDILDMKDEQAVADFTPEPAAPEDGLDILLIDSSLNNRLLFSMLLRDTNHRITEAHDGQEGVEAFQRGRFDIVFMDMEMPLMDGYQATRIIRALEADSGRVPTPIVAMTSYALPEFRRQCLVSGCSEFLTKPFTKIALFSMLDAFKELQEDARKGVSSAGEV